MLRKNLSLSCGNAFAFSGIFIIKDDFYYEFHNDKEKIY